jgi:hypothetical protein
MGLGDAMDTRIGCALRFPLRPFLPHHCFPVQAIIFCRGLSARETYFAALAAML